ncbi:MAG: PLDc N-terminal domain-containing protein [Ardenticatenaceae bacterium]|nr:PLDc N-terminal domain-containing protein [Ardenticatenaceae bacterium]
MENLGINMSFLILQLINIAFLIGWPIVSIIAVVGLRKRKLAQAAQALWILIILVTPFLGAIAYWLVQPSENHVA